MPERWAADTSVGLFVTNRYACCEPLALSMAVPERIVEPAVRNKEDPAREEYSLPIESSVRSFGRRDRGLEQRKGRRRLGDGPCWGLREDEVASCP